MLTGWAIDHPVARVFHYMKALQHVESRTPNISDIADCPPSENSFAEALEVGAIRVPHTKKCRYSHVPEYSLYSLPH